MLVDRGTLTPDELARVIAERFGVDYVDLSVYSVDLRACSLVTPEAARRYEAVPIGYKDERTLLLVTSDPANVLAIDDVAMMTGLRRAPGRRLARGHRRADRQARPPRATSARPRTRPSDEDELLIGDVRDADDDAPVIKLVHSIIAEAIELRRERHPLRARRRARCASTTASTAS